MVEMVASRAHPLDGKVFGATGVQLVPAGEAFRCNLRVGEKDVAKISKALGVDLPTKPKQSATKGSRTALWLGPDEWLVIDERADPNVDLKKSRVLHSAVDISHRNTAIQVNGTAAADVINAGCPQDLSLEAFPVGACSRTIMGKIEIVLLRTKRDQFRVECWRSFSDYAFDFLSTAAKDAG